MADYYTVMTEIGRIKLAQASANNGTLNLATMALGDGAGNPVALPDGYEEALVNEVYRAAINSVVDDGAQFTVDMIVPPEEGGWVVREMGVFDNDGDLIAYANTPPIDKPAAQVGIAIDFRPTLTVEFDGVGNVTIQINPAIISASQQWVDDNYLAQSRNLSDLSDKDAARDNLGAGQAGGLAQLDAQGQVPQDQLPPQRLSETFPAADEVEMLALPALKGDMCVRTDIAVTFVLKQEPASTLGNWIELQASNAVSSVAGKTGTVTLEKSDVGLANVDNTSDADKPVSTAQGQAISTAQSNAAGYTDAQIGALNKASVGLGNVNNTSDANKPVSTAQGQAISTAQSAVQTNLNTHASNTSNAHGATPAATKSALMRRDAAGRAQVEAPNAAKDIANKEYVDGRVGRIRWSSLTPTLNSWTQYGWGYRGSVLRYIEVRNATYLRIRNRERGFKFFYNTSTVSESTRDTSGPLSVIGIIHYELWTYTIETDGELRSAYDIPVL